MDAGPISPAKAGSAVDRRQRFVAILLMCSALVCFSALDATAKWLNHVVDPLLVVWARYVSSVALVSLFVNPWSTPGVTSTARPWLQVGRSLLLLLSTALNFIALQYLQLSQTISIMFSAPFILALIAGPLLGERIGPRRLAAVVVGFGGVLIVARPGFGGLHPAALLSLAGAVCYSFYAVTTRLLAAHDSSQTTLFYSGLAGVALMTPLLPFIWTTPASPLVWVLLLVTGALGTLGHWLLILAHARAPAMVLSPFLYTQIVWMVALGYLVFGDVPDRWTLTGAAVVIASGLYLLHREHVRTLPPAP